MIFGIKTRKDKKIDELQKEIERLKYTQSYKVSQVSQESYDIKKLSAVFYVPFEQVDYIPDGYVKATLAHQLEDNLREFISVSENTDYDNCRRVYRATLNVCVRRNSE